MKLQSAGNVYFQEKITENWLKQKYKVIKETKDATCKTHGITTKQKKTSDKKNNSNKSNRS